MIKPETLEFLSSLTENNNRDWFQLNKGRHDAARENVLDFASQLIQELSKTDPVIPPDLDPKHCVMRIYRDIRFSLDKTPYKTNFGIGISAQGKSFNGPGYYVHIHPENPFVAGGCWMPDATLLKSIRQEIDYNGTLFRDILSDPQFLKNFDGPDRSHILKLLPKGFTVDHPEIEYLKLKSFTCTHNLTTADLRNTDSVKRISGILGTLKPFMDFLRTAGN